MMMKKKQQEEKKKERKVRVVSFRLSERDKVRRSLTSLYPITRTKQMTTMTIVPQRR
jgi:hypothetical protein